MSHYQIPIIFAVVFAIVGSILSYLINKNDDTNKFAKPALALIVSGIIGFMLPVIFFLNQQYTSLEESINSYKNSFSVAKKTIDKLDEEKYPITKSIFESKLNEFDLKFEKIATQNQIVIEKSDVLNIWNELINNAKFKFHASNVVLPEDWQYVNSNNFGVKPQLLAMKRNVDVKESISTMTI